MTAVRRLVVQTRPRFWLYLAGPVLVGLVFGVANVEALVSPLALVLFAYFLVPANAFLYGINDLFDADLDAANPKKADREVRSRRGADEVVFVGLAAVLGLGLIAVLPPVAVPYLIGFLVLGAAYSVPPVRLKTKPPLDSLSNGLYILPGAAAYAAFAGAHPPALVLLGGWLWTMAMHTFSAIPDIEPDRRGGIRTTATVLGRRGALGYCGGVWSLAAVAFAAVDPRAGILLAVYPAMVAAVLLRDVEIARAYWWYPTINTVVGMTFTLAGLWRVVGG